MMFFKNGKAYDNVVEYYLDEHITLCFGEPKPLEEEFFDEAFDITISNQKNSKVNVYIRNHKEGYGKDEEHAASVKVRAVADDGREFGPDVVYRIPRDNGKYKTCEIIDKNKRYTRFDREYGDMVRAFVDHSQNDLNDYWYASGDDIVELKKIESKIRKRYNKHVKNKKK